MENEQEFGDSFGAFHVDSILDSGVFTPPTNYHVYEIVPNPTATIKAVPRETTKDPYFTSNREDDGDAIQIFVSINGQYTQVTCTAGSCVCYCKRTVG